MHEKGGNGRMFTKVDSARGGSSVDGQWWWQHHGNTLSVHELSGKVCGKINLCYMCSSQSIVFSIFTFYLYSSHWPRVLILSLSWSFF